MIFFLHVSSGTVVSAKIDEEYQNTMGYGDIPTRVSRKESRNESMEQLGCISQVNSDDLR